MKVDYIIVGLGLAGLAFAEQLVNAGKSFVVFEDGSQQASKVAAGVYNPVILKRFTPVWDAAEQLAIALPFYDKIASRLGINIDFPIDIIRPFSSIEEQNDWFAAADKPFFEKYMCDTLFRKKLPFINAPYGYGRLRHTGLIDTTILIQAYKNDLLRSNALREERFEYEKLKVQPSLIEYKDVVATHIVCCEGYGVIENPYFKDIPLREAKGELVIIHAPQLQLHFLLKAGVFVLPLGNDLYKIGATFNWVDKTQLPTDAGKKELLTKFEKICTVPYTVKDQLAGIRPTVIDRRPILGKHPACLNVAILNGFGTRGVMLAPKMAQLLFSHLTEEAFLPSELALSRFKAFA
ncbi:FAD-binding oxidoreductase [Flavobacteriaceae bacterium F08102]|nr:FAD-binding oxidoreductase [Flavobacteriaceae bacterium F08102]